MTSTPVITAEKHALPLGTVAVIPWASDPDSDEAGIPFLMLYPLGDGSEGAEGSTEAMRSMLVSMGLSMGDELMDLSKQPRIPISLLVEGGQAVLTLSSLKVQCPVPPEWEQAAKGCGQVYFISAVRPWPVAVPGRPVDEETLRSYVGDTSLLETSAHCLLPVRSLRV
ncbi:DUF5949 family protein [Streptomyces beijiangensis]|uniref:Uncharacterized protein n=1 Tax=Streptomyces beijiangensis TaxID=163361 RepID=A0A939FAB9_9ACTN|nr:DUF5949 family protein [Streptomyces beijiangensis]MBO0514433.1 hypothetical protein [Streptomyces beijiangensis]